MSKPHPDPTTEPVSVEIQSGSAMFSMVWADGHTSRYPYWYLRGYCPCAVCQGHGGGWDFVADVPCVLQDVAEVGNYALNVIWRDGHRTGIYAFEQLRRLCPCAVCRQQQGRAHPWARIPKRPQRT